MRPGPTGRPWCRAGRTELGRGAAEADIDERDHRIDFNEITGRLELDYPVLWVYKVIGSDEDRLRSVILEVVGEERVTVEVSNYSSGGNYVSLNVEVRVVSDEHRHGIYEALRRHDDVKLVL